jgi:putative colanic acid biosynthesis UDP-glucose lipid carrier transferase
MKRVNKFTILLFPAEDFILLNLIYIGILYIFGLNNIRSYYLLQLVINFGYLLSLAFTRFDLRNMYIRNIIGHNFYRMLITTVVFLATLFFLNITDVSRAFVLLFFTATFIILSVAHLVTRSIIGAGASCNAIILGAGATGRKVRDELAGKAHLGIQTLGFFDNDRQGDEILGVLEQAKDYAIANDVERIYCTLSLTDAQLKDFLNFSEANNINFCIIPPMVYASDDSVGKLPAFTVYRTPLDNVHNALFKRAFDLAFSGVVLLTLFPVIYLLLGALIKVSSRGPVLFVQPRNGRNGKIFKCYKFRSMSQGSDGRQATADDVRTTRIGRFLRRTNLDEIPQFINVFKGDMSVVGPRPHPLWLDAQYKPDIKRYMTRYAVKPGVTGWAQITGFRGETQSVEQMEARIKRDIWYLENWSSWLDLEIIVKTVFTTLKGDKNAY